MEDMLYKQNLAEWIYDEKKLVTYHYLSITLGVHVNLAKQMLYEFYKEDTAKNGDETLDAIFYVSGMHETNDNEECSKSYTSALCRADKLDDLKSKFSKIYSVHIYSVKHARSKDTLEKAMSETFELRNDGRAGPEYGPFKIIKPLGQAKQAVRRNSTPQNDEPKLNAGKIKIIKSEPAAVSTLKEEKLKGQEIKVNADVKLPQKKEPEENTKSEIRRESTSLSSTKKKEVQNGGKDRLKNMFANAKPPKPKEIKMEDPAIASQAKRGSSGSSISRKRPMNSSSKSAKQNNNKNTSKKTETTQRRRIKVFSSSSEDESDSNSNRNSDEGSDSELPIPKRRQIESDSESDDEDFQKLSTPRKESQTVDRPCLPAGKPGPPGRRRVTKTITKRVVDEDGYTVVKKEQVVVSESESDTEEKKAHVVEKDCVQAEIVDSKSPVKSIPRENNVTLKSSESTPTSKRSNNSQQSINGKAKQASITSFFQKKA